MTGGSPAMVLQLAGWVAVGNDAATAPTALVDLVGARLGRLPGAARRVLQALAIHGQVVPKKVAGAIVEKLDPQGAALGVLEREGLVVVGDEDYSIPFELVAQVAEAATPADARRALSRAVLGRATMELSLVEVAHHAESVGDLDRAIEAFVAAGDDAVRRFDDPRAAGLYHKAITLARLKGVAGRVVGLSLRLADVLRYMGQLSLAMGCLDEAERFEQGESQQAGIARGRGRILLMQGKALEAAAMFKKAIGAALRSGDRDFLCETYIDLANALGGMGNVGEAAAELSEGVDTITLGDGLARAEGPERLWVLGLRLASMLLRAKDLGGAKQTAKDAIAQAERVGSATGLGRLHAMLASVLEAMGDTHSALVHQAQALDQLRKLGDRRSTAELLLACARMTGDLPPVVASGSRRSIEASRKSRDTARKALEVAHELAAEIGWNWDDGLTPTGGTGTVGVSEA
jgi:tetratricopeptide (TPR) repeat protein